MDEQWRVGKRIQEVRQEKGFTQETLAVKLSTTERNVRKFEQKGPTNLDWLKRIADVLNVSILYLIPEEWCLSPSKQDLTSRLIHSFNQLTYSERLHLIELVEDFVSKQRNNP